MAFIDAAGAGGTSWSQVEKYRSSDPMKRLAAEAFADWGISTADCIEDIRAKAPDAFVIASGGLTHGVDAAKALALGAHLAGFGRVLLPGAAARAEADGSWRKRCMTSSGESPSSCGQLCSVLAQAVLQNCGILPAS